MQQIFQKNKIIRLSFMMGIMIALSFGFTLPSRAAEAHTRAVGAGIGLICNPTSTSTTAFPYTAQLPSSPNNGSNDCADTTSSFSWGYTETSASGQAKWDLGGVGGVTENCSFGVWIPSINGTATTAQYYIFDGSHYLANVIVNQQIANDEFVSLGSSTWSFTQDPIIQVSDKQASGAAGYQIAVSALTYTCTSN